MIRPGPILLLAVLAAGPACAGDPEGTATVDPVGVWTLAVTSGANGCALDPWTPGETLPAVPLTIAAGDGSLTSPAFTGAVAGLTGAFLDLVLGTSTLAGDVDDDRLVLTRSGTRPFLTGACSYTINGELRATLTGDAMVGGLTYRARTNGHPDCGALTTCTSEQTFTGSRPAAPARRPGHPAH